jgi:chemotaxis protein MotB
LVRKQRISIERGGHGQGHDGGGALRWLLTYADMITLLMAFFIMLYSMSILNMNRFKEVAVSIRSGFSGDISGQSRNGNLITINAPKLDDGAGVPWKVAQKIQNFVEQENLGKSVRMRVDERGLVISIVTDKVVFDKGQAGLSDAAKRIMEGVADALKQVPNQIRIEGHTCNLPVASAKYASNWELSTARATMVVRFFIDHCGIPASRLSAVGYADSKPLVPNTSEKNRALNRRVDVIVLRTGYRDTER